MPEFDVAILGGGNGGYACALRAAQLGLSVGLIEKGKLGGTCLHIGCIPTKALLHSADVLEQARVADKIGITIDDPGFDWSKVLSFKDGVVSKHYRGLQGLIKSRGINVVEGNGRLAGPGAIDVDGGEQVTAAAVVLASGSYARSLPFIPIDGDVFVVSDHCLSMGEVPASL
ncbi:MAG: FAD-dependent oxidoreductase, partial [Actinomycetota bacterium]